MNRLLPLLITILSLFHFATTGPQDDKRKPAEVRILNAETMEAPYRGMDAGGIRLLGDVRLMHEEVQMHCDSAHRYSARNIVHAFGNVHINQGDTLHLYGDRLIYYGDRRFAEVRGNVVLQDQETTLKTQRLDFDLERNFGYYPDHGVVTSGDNKLESRRGYYYADDKLFFFRENVVITNPDYIIRSDTLRYNTETEVVYFLGPTTILGDDTDIYCENGWYNTITDISQFNENARVRNNNQSLSADSIYYDNAKGYGKAFLNVEITDTVENIIISGHYAWFNRDPEEMLITDRALLKQMTDNDTLYVHADTLRSWLQAAPPEPEPVEERLILQEEPPPDPEEEGPVPQLMEEPADLTEEAPGPQLMGEPADTTENDTVLQEPGKEPETILAPFPGAESDTLPAPDTVLIAIPPVLQDAAVKPHPDSVETDEENDTVRVLVAYYGVRMFSNQMQGKCDSLYYNMRDSVIYMFADPVLWSDESQLSAEIMEIHLKEDEVDYIVMTNSAFIVSEEQPGLYNQIKGTNVVGFFNDGELYRVNVTGNAETLYYPADEEEIIGINKAMSASLVIFLKDNKPDRIRFLNRVESVLYPMEDLQGEERLLPNFRWLDQIRPKNRDDVFRR